MSQASDWKDSISMTHGRFSEKSPARFDHKIQGSLATKPRKSYIFIGVEVTGPDNDAEV
jgi:hypothetical protein